MRRLLAALLTLALELGLFLALAGPAFAGGRVPGGVTKVSVTLRYPLKSISGNRRPVHRTFTRASTVAAVIRATDALPAAKTRGVCPMLVRLGPELTVVYKSASGNSLATAAVQVIPGRRGSSGSSACFPIRFTSGGRSASLIGNSWVRMMGRLLGTAIS